MALISLAGTALGAFGGILTANRLVQYRLEQLEKKVDKHNTVIDRMYAAEKRLDVYGERLEGVSRRLAEWERGA